MEKLILIAGLYKQIGNYYSFYSYRSKKNNNKNNILKFVFVGIFLSLLNLLINSIK